MSALFQEAPEDEVDGGAVFVEVAGDSWGGPALGGQADHGGPEAGFLVGLRVQGEFQQEPVLLRGQLDLKRGCHVDMIRGWH